MRDAWRLGRSVPAAFRGRIGFSLLVCLACGSAPSAAPASPRVANYTIEVRLDPTRRTLEGHQIVEWRNGQAQPTRELWFHLYWNAWRNDRSTWMLEDLRRERSRQEREEIRPGDWGWIEVDRARLVGPSRPALDLLPGLRYAAPDDGNADDRTVMVLTLPEPVPPGASVHVELDWRAKIPRTFARTGFRGDFYFFAHWFPKLGVLEERGWNCHQYHAATEYFADYGTYRVSMTVPQDWVLGATGRELARSPGPDGTVTHLYEEHDVHEFAWTVSPAYEVHEARFVEPGLPAVALRLLLQPEHRSQAERHLEATRVALYHYGTWFGPYPYPQLTIVDPAYGSGAGGMEYPTLFTCGTRLFAPRGGDVPESVTVHEAGHQFWYGLVGNNEFEHAWLDEGLNTYAQVRALDAAYGPRRLVQRYLPAPGSSASNRGFFPLVFRDIEAPRLFDRLDRYRAAAHRDAPSTATFLYQPETAADITYSKTALWLGTLERHLGWERLRTILATFFERYRFGHPTPDAFFAVVDEHAGEDLRWFFDAVYRDAVDFDYAVGAVSSAPRAPRGFVEREGRLVLAEPPARQAKEAGPFRSEVVVERRGDGVFPVDVRLVFADGTERQERWDGRGRHHTIVVEDGARLEYAVVDPERKLLLDLDYTNNSRLRESRATAPAFKWASKWMVWFQDFLTTFTFFA